MEEDVVLSANEQFSVTCNVAALDVVGYFAARDQAEYEPSMTPLKLHKLMYLAQANYLASTGCRLFNENTVAFRLGPVYASVWTRFSGSEVIAKSVSPQRTVDELGLAKDVIEFLDEVWERFGKLTASALVNLSHEHDPWRDNYDDEESWTVIPDEQIAEFFRLKAPENERVLHRGIAILLSEVLDDYDDDAVVEEFFSQSSS
jgi:uncharacterized phage-associated protein